MTFGTLKAKAAVRDVGRVLDIPLSDVDRIAKMIPEGPKVSLDSALKDSPDLKKAFQNEPQTKKLIENALRVEGLHRHTGMHAAGVVITDQPLNELIPIFKTPNEDELITQFEMKNVTELGLLKMDFLGLKNLTVIDDAIKIIEKNHGVKIDWPEIGFDDAETYQLTALGRTLGVFQLESSGMRGVCQNLKPTCFADVAAVIALYRPGPMENIPTFIANKHDPSKVKYLHPKLEPILKETYGIVVYQEQVAQIANQLAGFSLGEGDILRKAMGKKMEALMNKMQPKFIEGCEKNEISENIANEIWSQLVEFAKYGFNKAHTVAYAVVTFRTAYLKAHYPTEFMASLMTHDMGNLDKMPVYFQEAKEMDISILPISINASGATFTPEEKNIRYGLAAIKNVGRAAIDAIIEERKKNGIFEDFNDFATRIDQKKLNSRMIESMIKVGAFDAMGIHRAQLLDCMAEILELAAHIRDEKESGQASLFDELDNDDGGGSPLDHYIMRPVMPWTTKQTLDAEKELTGYYMSGHPL